MDDTPLATNNLRRKEGGTPIQQRQRIQSFSKHVCEEGESKVPSIRHHTWEELKKGKSMHNMFTFLIADFSLLKEHDQLLIETKLLFD